MSKGLLFMMIGLWVFSTQSLFGQEADPVRDLIENLSETWTEDNDISELTDRLQQYLNHPLNLNKAGLTELNELMFLSPLQIQHLLDHIRINGPLSDLLELQSVEGFDSKIINLLLPFVKIDPLPLWKKPDSGNGGQSDQHDLILRYGRILEQQKGFKELPGSRYLGSADKMLVRYLYRNEDWFSAALVAEKDAGEYWWRKPSGPDHLSFHLSAGPSGMIKRIIIGDYSLQFGQGLTLWTGFSFGKGPDVTSVASKETGLKPYRSTNESSFLRGAAATIQLGKYLEMSSFISFRKLDASVKYNDSGAGSVQNINISGLHRTTGELKNQKTLEQFLYGSALHFNKNQFTAGIVAYHSHYQHEFVTGNAAYNQFAFRGKTLLNMGANYGYTYRNVYSFGEGAYSWNSGWAVVNGLLISISSKTSVVLLHRNYDKDYHNFLSSGVGEGTEINNEKGFYTGLNYSPFTPWTFSFYGDYFRFPWLKYRIDSASAGYEAFSQASYTPSKKFRILLRYKREIKQQNPPAGSAGPVLEKVCRQNLRLDWTWQQSRRFSFHQRVERSDYRKGDAVPSIGYMLLMDMDFKPKSKYFSGNFRMAYFDTPSYDSRIYAYEDNVLYGASSAVYSGQALRSYLNLRVPVRKGIDVWGRYAIYHYFDRDRIGSALDEISGKQKSELKIQMRCQF